MNTYQLIKEAQPAIKAQARLAVMAHVAGYIDISEVLYTVELTDYFVCLVIDNADGGYMVSLFHKPTGGNSRGGWDGNPEFEGSYDDCLDHIFSNFKS